MALVFGSLALGQASGFATSYSVAKQAGMKVFSLLDRKSNIDSYSEDGKKLVSNSLILEKKLKCIM